MTALVESHRRAFEKMTARAKREVGGCEEKVWTEQHGAGRHAER